MNMALSILDVTNASYRTTRTADAQCGDLLVRLGYKVRYLAARLAISRSLSLASPVSTSALDDDEEESSNAIRGQQLFGDGSDPAAWLAVITQRAGIPVTSRRDFQALVAAHWRRGAELLVQDWEEANGSLSNFVARLADLASFNGDGVSGYLEDGAPSVAIDSEVSLPVGEVAEDMSSGERVLFGLNAPGGSPHMAIMGGVGSGKTRTAVHMLKKLREFGPIPILAFDFKGDLSDSLADTFGAQVVSPPRIPVPLNCLHVDKSDDTGLREAAGRIRESIVRVKTSKVGGVQADALREAVLQVLKAAARGQLVTMADVSKALATEYTQRNRRPDELTSTLNELTQFSLFEPSMTPAEFFSRSWIIRLPQDGTNEVRKLIINLTLDALDRWLNSQSDAPIYDGRRSLRHICMLDEAHVILSSKLPALGNLVRMSRSKGGVSMLVSQSPDDFEGYTDGFLDNMGPTMAFTTQAKAGPTRAIFGNGVSLVDLPVGQTVCRIRTDGRVRRIQAWNP
jgi:hypothetical protein